MLLIKERRNFGNMLIKHDSYIDVNSIIHLFVSYLEYCDLCHAASEGETQARQHPHQPRQPRDPSRYS